MATGKIIFIFISVLLALIGIMSLYLYWQDYLAVRKFLNRYWAVKIFFQEYHLEILKKQRLFKTKRFWFWDGIFISTAKLNFADGKSADIKFLELINKAFIEYDKINPLARCRISLEKEVAELLLFKQIIE